MRVILSRHKYKSSYDWRFINSAEHRDIRIGIQDLAETAAWLAERQLHLCVENVRHRDVDGRWIITTFWADLTFEQHTELKLTLVI